MFWRRANRRAVWITIAFSFVFFFALPSVVSHVPGMRTQPGLTTTTNLVTTTFTRLATPADVARREAWESNQAGAEPPAAVLGQPIKIILQSGGQAIFWQGGVKPLGQRQLKTVDEREEGGRHILVQQSKAPMLGLGDLRIDFLIYKGLGLDLANASKATLETLRLPTRLLLPFLVLIFVSFFTQRNSPEALDRYYVKMRTEVNPDHESDRRNLEKSYQNPKCFEDRLLFPGTDLEFVKPRPKDYLGFLASVAICFAMVGLLVWLAGIGG